jgi:predicted metalloprotease with PDZ domain
MGCIVQPRQIMSKSVFFIVLGLLVGIATAAFVLRSDRTEPNPVPQADPALYFDRSAAAEDRIAALEAVVAEERNARLLLEDELQALYAEIEALVDASAQGDEMPQEQPQPSREELLNMRQSRDAADSQQRRDRLVEAGFSPDRAEWILTRESELQMAQMQALFEARQSGERPDWTSMSPGRTLREEIGDREYEQYLEANGQPTSVWVGSVLETSPGQRAGLQPGDKIVAYGGERVFSYNDLRDATMSRKSGQSVVVDVVRDGIPMQVVVDSGPIGISERSAAIRFRR